MPRKPKRVVIVRKPKKKRAPYKYLAWAGVPANEMAKINLKIRKAFTERKIKRKKTKRED